MHVYDVVIVGAGPAGLATAIAAKQRELDYLVIEKGVLVNSLFRFPVNMVYFTTPELLEIGNLPLVTPYDKPTRIEALRYYRRVVETYQLDIAFDEEVVAVMQEQTPGGEPILSVDTRTARGVRRTLHGRTVVIATGSYDHPNRIGVTGEDLPHVSHYYTEPHPYYRKHVLIVGGKNSAAEAALDLYRSGALVTLVHRGPALADSIKYWVKPDIDNRIREGAIPAFFNTRVLEIRPTEALVEGPDGRRELPADAVFLLTGYHSDTALFARCGIGYDAGTCEPTCDPETFETNVPNLFVAGSVIAGRRGGHIFIENGRFHGEQVIRTIARRLGA